MIRVKRYKKLLGVIIIVLIVILLIIVIEIRGRERTAQQQQQQIAAPLTVASQFMGDPNITKCQTGTSLHLGRYVGNTIPTEIGRLTIETTTRTRTTRFTRTIQQTIQQTSIGCIVMERWE